MSLCLDVLEWFDASDDVLARRVPQSGGLSLTASLPLVVRESQEAWLCVGPIQMERFSPGRHELTRDAVNEDAGSFLVFLSRRGLANLSWDTGPCLRFTDPRRGSLSLRARGSASLRIHDARRFVRAHVGDATEFTTGEAVALVRDRVAAHLPDAMAAVASLFDLPPLYDGLGEHVAGAVDADLVGSGLRLDDFFLSSLLPVED